MNVSMHILLGAKHKVPIFSLKMFSHKAYIGSVRRFLMDLLYLNTFSYTISIILKLMDEMVARKLATA